MAEQKQYDFIVIGSGSSGAVAAYWLQQGGAKVLMLEAGVHYRTPDFPMPEHRYSSRLFWGGGVEYNTRCNLFFLRARCVGGTSIVNGALMDRFDDVALDDWKTASGIDYFSEAALDEHYTVAEQNIALEMIPDEQRNNNALSFIRGMENIGRVWKPIRRCQNNCGIEEGNDCIACLGGCHRGSKQSMLVTYIPRAQHLGLELISQFHVDRLDYHPEGVTVHGGENGNARSFKAPKVVLACGALGNTQLLLRSGFKPQLPALGTRFCMHPQYMNFALFKDPVDAHKGVLQGAKSLDPEFRRQGFKLENVFAPPISVAILFRKVGRDLHEFMRQYRHMASIEVCVRDEATGRIDIDRNGKLRVHKELTGQDRQRAENGRDAVHRLFASLQPEAIVHSPFYFGLHLMGGCPIGTDGTTSVVNPEFQVHNHAHLHTADSSVFPNAPGINPALTIMALSHKMAMGLLRT
ncbi:MAG: GMC family oxidoreductase [Candidatus Hydrogenedentes bacterium]|nr:GMC family oxidoreductase [Candidatus Hydrogenedentota bacterium]